MATEATDMPSWNQPIHVELKTKGNHGKAKAEHKQITSQPINVELKKEGEDGKRQPEHNQLYSNVIPKDQSTMTNGSADAVPACNAVSTTAAQYGLDRLVPALQDLRKSDIHPPAPNT
jgi:hypothetical protein